MIKRSISLLPFLVTVLLSYSQHSVRFIISSFPLRDLSDSNLFIAGSFNAIGFFTLTKALQLVSIVQVNAVSASQSALAAMAGVAIAKR